MGMSSCRKLKTVTMKLKLYAMILKLDFGRQGPWPRKSLMLGQGKLLGKCVWIWYCLFHAKDQIYAHICHNSYLKMYEKEVIKFSREFKKCGHFGASNVTQKTGSCVEQKQSQAVPLPCRLSPSRKELGLCVRDFLDFDVSSLFNHYLIICHSHHGGESGFKALSQEGQLEGGKAQQRDINMPNKSAILPLPLTQEK